MPVDELVKARAFPTLAIKQRKYRKKPARDRPQGQGRPKEIAGQQQVSDLKAFAFTYFFWHHIRLPAVSLLIYDIMKRITRNPVLLVFLLAIAGTFTACEKSERPVTGSSHLDLYLTDAPGDYKEVWIDLEKVMVQGPGTDSAGGEGWVEVPLLHPGLYNLLDFRNGADTVLGGVDLMAGKLSQIRLVLGEDNALVLEDGTTLPLTTPSAQQSGLKLNVQADLKPGIPYALVLDFDIARSIVAAGNSGKYLLKPVIRTFAKEAGGAIEGVVLPDEANAHVKAIVATDTLTTIPDSSGYFKFWGIAEGSYQIIFAADSTTGYQSDTLNQVTVTTGEVTQLDSVVLVQ